MGDSMRLQELAADRADKGRHAPTPMYFNLKTVPQKVRENPPSIFSTAEEKAVATRAQRP